ncbi:substance-P receptor-like [Glandiceps talaboti]
MENFSIFMNDTMLVDGNMTTTTAYPNYFIIPRIQDHLIKILTAVFAISVVLSSVGNVVVVCVMTCARRRKASLNTLMLNLAMSDWTLGLLCLPFLFAGTMMGEWIFGKVMCAVVPFVWKVAQIVSIFTVTVIGLDRYYVVMYPLKRKLSMKGKNIIIIVIWVAAAALSSPQCIYATLGERFTHEENRTFYICYGHWPSVNYKEMYVWLLFTLTYLIPLILLSTCYVQIALKLWRRTLPGHIDAQRDREQEATKRKAIRTLISLIILFAVCWLPVNFYNLFVITYNPVYLRTHWENTVTSRACIFIWLILSDTVFNPIAYVFLSENFRKNIKILVVRIKSSLGMDVEYPYSDGSSNATYTTRFRVKQSESVPMKTL